MTLPTRNASLSSSAPNGHETRPNAATEKRYPPAARLSSNPALVPIASESVLRDHVGSGAGSWSSAGSCAIWTASSARTREEGTMTPPWGVRNDFDLNSRGRHRIGPPRSRPGEIRTSPGIVARRNLDLQQNVGAADP